ncbi:hypothetical protein [Rothia nasimurium]|uniref:hypothetical protein n=1 Tax=Rothia nasimurium TaxID=85336 RepID=UPI0034DF9B31
MFESNLDGRGGASFSTYRKLTTTHQSTKTTIIANGAEGEYLSHKDRTLLLHAPHLVLDGLQIAGELSGTRNLALYAREESLATIAPLAAARGITCYTAPGTFISGEASAAANAITTGTPLPMNHTRRLAHPEKPQASSAKPATPPSSTTSKPSPTSPSSPATAPATSPQPVPSEPASSPSTTVPPAPPPSSKYPTSPRSPKPSNSQE